MKFNLRIHHRRSMRLKGYDYAQAGAYLITIVTKNRECLFGEIVITNKNKSKMVMNDFGRIIHNEWMITEKIRPNVTIDEFIVMPDHLHGIIIINPNVCNHLGLQGLLGVYCNAPPHPRPLNNNFHSFHSPSKTIGSIVRGFKSSTTKHLNEIRKSPSVHIWQRNYHDHIIRNEQELFRIRKYIRTNPARWKRDKKTWQGCIDIHPCQVRIYCHIPSFYVPE